MQEPERLTATIPIIDRSLQTIESLRPELLALRWSLKAQLERNGWKDVALTDVRAKMYFVRDTAHLVALHVPIGVNAMLVGGGSYDGAVIPLDGSRPPLTMGVTSGFDDAGYGCACFDACGDCRSELVDEPAEWTCWQLAGVTKSDGEWFIAYRPASADVNRQEQQLHNLGSVHEPCSLCRLDRWTDKASRLKLPPRITTIDAMLHVECAPHVDTFCTACRAGLEMGTPC